MCTNPNPHPNPNPDPSPNPYQGLESLTSLTNLSLFSNRITHIGGMDALTKLQLLSLGTPSKRR